MSTIAHRHLLLIYFIAFPCFVLGQPPHDDLSLFISKFGNPDQIQSSENESPRPLIVTKQLIYINENVRAVYFADAPAGSAPPYNKWKLLGFQNHTTNEVLKPSEVVVRLKNRQRH